MSGALDLSLGETEALIVKAARGADLPWGLAVELGAAARRSLSRGDADVVDAFAAFLCEIAESGLGPPEDCPLRAGFYAIDGGEAPIPAHVIASPVFSAVASDEVGRVAARCVMKPETHAALDALARRTYAPATESSRRRGAG